MGRFSNDEFLLDLSNIVEDVENQDVGSGGDSICLSSMENEIKLSLRKVCLKIISNKGEREMTCDIWVKVFKNQSSKICRRQSLKILK